MKTDDLKKMFVWAAVACFALVGIYNIYQAVSLQKMLSQLFADDDLVRSVVLPFAFGAIIAFGFAVTLFLRKKAAVASVSALYTVYRIFILVRNFRESEELSLFDLVYLLACVAIAVLLVLSIKYNRVVTNIWFLGGALLLLAILIYTIQTTQDYDMGLFEYLSGSWSLVVFELFEVAGFTLIGLWLKKEMEDTPPLAVGVTQSTPAAIGGADQLKVYKDLLDSGAITQAEFDQKKKEILG